MTTFKKVDAIYDDDLLKLMENLEIQTLFLESALHCAFCEEVITWENIHSIFPDQNRVKVCCTNPQCVNRLIARFKSS